MTRQKVAIILGLPGNYDVLAFKYFILAINKIQAVYEFSFPEQGIIFENEEYAEKELFKEVELVHEMLSLTPDYSIAIITRKIKGNLFFASNEHVAAITTDMWEAHFSPPSLFEYLLHCIMASLLFMHPKLNLDSHRDTRGCVLDFTLWKSDDRVDIALGYICDSDCESIRQSLGDDYLRQMQLVISREWIGAVSDRGSVAFELKHSFRFDIDRDSGFNKTLWEKTKAKLGDLSLDAIKTVLQAIIAATLLFLGFKKS